MNQDAGPDFYVWKQSLTLADISDAFLWSEVKTLPAGEARVFEWMMLTGVIDPSKTNVRAGIASAFQTSASNSYAAILTASVRKCSAIEYIFACATGSGTVGSPATLVFAGPCSEDDIIKAMTSA